MSNTASTTPLGIRTATPSSVRAVNRSIMLELIRRHHPISRADLARLTGVFRSSVSDIVDELVAEGLVLENRDATNHARGRVPMSLRLNETSYQVLGLNVRPSYCQVAYAGLSGHIQNSLTFETPTSPKKLVRAVKSAVSELTAERGPHNTKPFQRMGVAIPGHVDALSGRILWTPTHTELADFPIADEIRQQTGIETVADNDCNVGALSELWLSTERKKDHSTDFVFLNVSDFGTGGGAVLNGETYLGHDGHFAAEVGHMIVEPSGPECRCGRHGCWELYVSNCATWSRVHPRTPFDAARFEQMLLEAQQGDARSRKSVLETARYLSLGISNIGYAFNPAEVVIAGRITAAWDLIQPEILRGCSSPHLHYAVRPARLSADDSLLHGAVCLALRETFAGPKFGQN
jgi:predicted NBD/HSP70 family sugar kinase